MSFLVQDLSQRLNHFRDEQGRTVSALEARLKALEDDNTDLRMRLSVLTRLLILRQIATAEEVATMISAPQTPATAPNPVASEALTPPVPAREPG